MVNVRSKRCFTCPTLAEKKQYKGYCYRCFIHTFPDNSVVRNHKTKERTVADFVRQRFPDVDIVLDQRIQGGCSGRRPDILLDMGSHVVIIEIDENQHGDYDCTCENKRLMELFQDAGNRPMCMIRFNPDQYRDQHGKSVPSCWGYTKDRGLCVVKDKYKQVWEKRLDVLKQHIDHIIDAPTKKEVDVLHLFYDGWSLG